MSSSMPGNDYLQKKEQALELLSPPTASTKAGYGLRFSLLALGGVGAVAGGAALLAFSPAVIVVGSVLSAAYAAKVGRDIYKNHVKEKELAAAYNLKVAELVKRLEEIDLNQLHECAANIADDDWKAQKKFYASLLEINQLIETLIPVVAAKIKLDTPTKEKNDVELESLNEFRMKWESDKDQLWQLSESFKNQHDLAEFPEKKYTHIPSINIGEDDQKNNPTTVLGKLWQGVKKLGNRAWAFGLAASIPLGIAGAILGAATGAFLLSNPIGWGIIGATILCGVVGVAIEYKFMRQQQEKIKLLASKNIMLQQQTDAIDKIYDGLRLDQAPMPPVPEPSMSSDIPSTQYRINQALHVFAGEAVSPTPSGPPPAYTPKAMPTAEPPPPPYSVEDANPEEPKDSSRPTLK